MLAESCYAVDSHIEVFYAANVRKKSQSGAVSPWDL